ncbi:hypothetical protein A3A95_03990 [Candidatus Nomurabacteria bacterium RIFCSPLOWO2_01_FULL_39_18]|uniref:GGDEF domain-containing protein n=1 Tax=Candidatus Nomurabacteria bacterium RIFCSPHIGHO2_01_FULL_40_24b TaxID=1801739 RepID=A0A1F6V694_9BACT|nr:MAG: hypothetical protein A2647_04530 [Candidatus Nomurabacteria bacterium RIFCSPHIGHO2_01_FULL_40_24b]OGI89265.1 MAG: hypothetical protein A3A95_03990 [Candidatus Nomurabacteria bacterium RIFCSPLOWO2_01_FULL_39_18]
MEWIPRKPPYTPEKTAIMENPKTLKDLKDLLARGVCTVNMISGALAREAITKDQYIELITVLARKQEGIISSLETNQGIDTFTGCYNRLGLERKLPALIKQLNQNPKSESTPDSIMAIAADIDDFKVINDRHGHPVGDQAIKAVAQRLQEAVKELGGDLVFHPHGDEFRMVLSIRGNLDDVKLKKIFTRIQDKVNTNLIVKGVKINEDESFSGEPFSFKITIAMGYAILGRNKSSKIKAEQLAGELVRASDTNQLKDKKEEVKRARISRYNNPSILTQ